MDSVTAEQGPLSNDDREKIFKVLSDLVDVGVDVDNAALDRKGAWEEMCRLLNQTIVKAAEAAGLPEGTDIEAFLGYMFDGSPVEEALDLVAQD